jgi:predicted metal-binding protein
MELPGVRCTKASDQDQSKLDYYVEKVSHIIFNT